jgi:hypothetical protein
MLSLRERPARPASRAQPTNSLALAPYTLLPICREMVTFYWVRGHLHLGSLVSVSECIRPDLHMTSTFCH